MAMARPSRQQVQRGLAGGRKRIAVLDSAAQCPRSLPDPQAARSGTMAHRVGGQFVDGQHHVFGPVRGQPGPADVNLKARPQHVERARIEHQIQDRGGRFGYRAVIGH
jgi:hypothetical protein